MFIVDFGSIVLIWVVCAIAAAYFADRRGLGMLPLWFVAGLILGPIGVIASLTWTSAAPLDDSDVDDTERPSPGMLVAGVIGAIAVVALIRMMQLK